MTTEATLSMTQDQKESVIAKLTDYEQRLASAIKEHELEYMPPEVLAAKVPVYLAIEIVNALLAAENGVVVLDSLFRNLESAGLFSFRDGDGEAPAVEHFERYANVWIEYLAGNTENTLGGTGFGATLSSDQT